MAQTSGRDIPWTSEEVKQATAGYGEEISRCLVRLTAFAETKLHGSREELLRILGYPDWTTVTRVFTGKYEKPENFFETRVKPALKIVRASSYVGFVDTEVTANIKEMLDLCRDLQTMVAIVGGAGRSKTEAVRDWQLANRSTAVYVDAEPIGGVKAFLIDMARQLGLSHKGAILDLKNAIEAKFERQSGVILIDEVVRILPSSPSPRSAGATILNFLQRLHDHYGVSVAWIATDIFDEAFGDPRLIKYMAQLHRRIDYWYRIPERVSKSETKAICTAFCPPEAPPDRAFLDYAHDLTQTPDGVGPLFSFLRHARLVANLRNEDIALPHLENAVKFCRSRATGKTGTAK